MRYHLYRGMAVLFAVSALISLLLVSIKREGTQKTIPFEFMVGEEKIKAYRGQDAYYLFLPAYADLSQVQLAKKSDSFKILSNGRIISDKETLEGMALKEEIPCVNTETGESFSLVIMQSQNIPAMYLETESGNTDKLYADKDYGEKGTLKVRNTDGDLECSISLKNVSGRGNYSFYNYEKKPFTLTAGEITSILGLKEGRKWVLVSNASEPTLIRNELVKGMERALNVKMQSQGRFVDLYLNGEYIGNYYFCEKIEVGQSRVAITDLEEKMDAIYHGQNMENYPDYIEENMRGKVLDHNPDDITGGYLLEREFENRYEVEYDELPSSFITAGREHFAVKSPQYCSKEQIQYISSFVQEAEDAILAKDGVNPYTGKRYDAYIDVESFVKKYLIEEVSKNYDGGISSTYFYKDSDAVSSLLYAGPGWDYDMSFGNYLEWMEELSKDPKGITRLALHTHASMWYSALLEKEEYFDLVKRYYKDCVSPYLEELLLSRIDRLKEELAASAAMDYARWQEIYESNPYFTDRNKSFAELKDYIQKRKDYIDLVWTQE